MTTPHRTLQMALDALYSGESPPNARQQDAIAALREALAADHLRDVAEKVAPAAPVPAGWVMAPREPTPEMRKAAADAWLDCGSKLILNKAAAAIRAAIAASPAAPAAPVVPLTDEQIWSMWMSSEFRGNGGQADWFCEGIRAAEAHHGITGGKP